MQEPLTGPIDPHAAGEGQRIYAALPHLSGDQSIGRIPLHWSVEAYGCKDASYNIVVGLENALWIATVVTDPRLNATKPVQPGYAAATYLRNAHSCSVAANGMTGTGVGPGNFGSSPVQLHELEVMCAAAAAVAQRYGVDTHAIYDGVAAIATHAEFAIADGYYITDSPPDGVTRWDLAELYANQYGGTPTKEQAAMTGDHLRARVRAYKTTVRW